MSRKVLLLTCPAVMLLSIAAPSSADDDSTVLVSDPSAIRLSVADDGSATAAVTLQNNGPEAVEGALAVVDDEAAAGCTITPATFRLPPRRQTTVTLTFSERCQPDRADGTGFTLTTDGEDLALHAGPPDRADPDWGDVLGNYLLALAAAILLCAGTVVFWRFSSSAAPGRTATEKKLTMGLPGLDASWKFSDSWAANATVVTAVLTGLFGAKDVTDALLGDGTEDLLAVAIVCAAASVGLAGLSPMVVQMTRGRYSAEEAEPPDDTYAKVPGGLYVNPIGLTLAAVVTLTATGGQLLNLVMSLRSTDFATDSAIAIIGAMLGLALACYAVIATHQSLTTGAARPLAKPTEASIVGMDVAGATDRVDVLVVPSARPRAAAIL